MPAHTNFFSEHILSKSLHCHSFQQKNIIIIWINYQLVCVNYGIQRSLIGVGSITEVKQRRARFIIGWVTAWDCQVMYTLGHVARSDVLSWGSENHVNQMARLTRVIRKITSMDVGAVSIRWDPRKSTMCEYLAHKANLLGKKNSLMRLNGSSAVYLPGDSVGIWMITGLANFYFWCSVFWTASGWIHALYKISFIHSLNWTVIDVFF